MRHIQISITLLFFFPLISCNGVIQSSEKPVSETVSIKHKILSTYKKWVDESVKIGDHWYEADWKVYYDSWEDKDKYETDEYMDNCLDGLPDTLDTQVYGDINQDGELDCAASVFPLYCMEGTWSRFSDIHLFFISKPDGNYSIAFETEEIEKGIGEAAGYGVEKIMQNGIIIYKAYEYNPDDAMCCPSKERRLRFKYEQGQFTMVE